MSSIRNSLHRRNHKERGQLSHRKRLGILEKHKDYVQRARDFNEKKEKVKRLKQKAADRNKDEFYFGMVNKQTKGGVHYQGRGNTALPIDLVNVLKSQDEGYIRTTKTTNLKKIDSLKEELSAMLRKDILDESLDDYGLDSDWEEEDIAELQAIGILPSSSSQRKKPSRHIIFTENESEARNYSPPKAPGITTSMEVEEAELELGWVTDPQTSSAKRTSNKKGTNIAVNNKDHEGSIKKRKELLFELKGRLERDTHLRYALRELEMQRALMGKGASRKLHGPELIKPDGQADDELDEDEQDALFGQRRKIKPKSAPEMGEYKPRVYKFRPERKR